MRLTNEEISKTIELYGGIWIGGEYLNNRSKLKIKCSKCGKIIEKCYSSIKDSKNSMCKKCTTKNNRIEKNSFSTIAKSSNDVKEKILEIGGIILELNYINNKSKIKLQCPKCNKKFEKSYESIMRNENVLCQECTRKENGIKKSKNKEDEIISFSKQSGNEIKRIVYGEKIVKIESLCSECGSIIVTKGVRNFLKRKTSMCFKCSRKLITDKKRTKYDEVKSYVEKLGGELITKKYENNSQYLEIKCCKCHNIFERTFDVVKQYNSVKCPNCKDDLPKGEKLIKEILEKNNVEFHMQKCFNDCKRNNKLKFDFYIPSLNVCIEFNGEQHYQPIPFFGGIEKFKVQKEIDNIKKIYCKDNNIKLLIISYKDIFKINEILKINKIIPSQAS